MINTTSSPPDPIAVRFGYLALLPFALGAVLSWFGPADWSTRCGAATSTYAAVVVSFIGSIYWGLGLCKGDPRWIIFVWGVMTSLVAATALMLSVGTRMTVHDVMLVICYLVDHSAYPEYGIGG